jgi:hypothetical protein
MGNTKVIFLSGLCVIIGLYTYNIREADSKAQSASNAHVFRLQAEEVAKSGTQHAINKLGTAKPNRLPRLSNQSLFGGVLNYRCDDSGLDGDRVRITSSGTVSGHTITRIAVVNLSTKVQETMGKGKPKQWNQWEIEKVYVSDKKEDYKKSL